MRVVVLGGGIAGLAAGCALLRRGVEVTLLEAAPCAGGLATGFRDRGYTFDLFSHRFWTRDREVLALAESWVGAPLLERRKISRILLDGRLYNYPIDLRDLLSLRSGRLALRALFGYATARLGGPPAGDDFRACLTARYGTPLFDTFFGPYTEKLTGCSASRLSNDLATGAVPDTGLLTQLLHRLIGRVDPWDDFLYPRGGFMQLPEGMARAFRRAGGRLLLSHCLRTLRLREGMVREVVVDGPGGRADAIDCDRAVSTVPLPALLRAFDPPPDPEVVRAAARLKTRAMITVYLGIARERLTPDHWIYVPDPAVRFNRLSETTNYSDGMAPPGHTGICAEIACDPGDPVWKDDDASQVRTVVADLLRLGLLRSAREVEATWVRRFTSAYPVCTVDYRHDLDAVQAHLSGFRNLRLCGRQGAFWYGSTAQGIRQALDVARELDAALARAA